MWKKRVPLGAKISFSSLIDEIQNFTITNLVDRVSSYITDYGIIVREVNNVINGNEFKLIYRNGTNVDVSAGIAILESGLSYISTPDIINASVNELAAVGANNPFKLVARYSLINKDSVDIVDGFKYPGGGSTEYTTEQPTYYLAVIPHANTPKTNELILLSGYLDSSAELQSNSFHDIRQAFKLNSNVLNDTNLVFKDRAVTMQGPVIINSGLIVNDESKFTKGLAVSGMGYNLQVFGGDAEIIDGLLFADGIKFYNSDNTEAVSTITAGLKNYTNFHNQLLLDDGLKIGVVGITNIPIYDNSGNNLGNILTTGDIVTNPSNFRLIDINADIYSSSNSIVSFKWNYEDILLSGVTDGQETILKLNNDEPFTKSTKTIGTDTRWQTIISGNLNNKYVYFPLTENKYRILSHTDATSSQMILIIESGLTTADKAESRKDFSIQTPCRFIDSADAYVITIERQPGNLSDIALLSAGVVQKKISHWLPKEYVTNPLFTISLPTKATYGVTVQPVKKFEYGSQIKLNQDYNISPRYYYGDSEYTVADQVTILPTGIGTNRFYFFNQLQSLGTGSATVNSTPFGFSISITGWIDETHPNKNPHEFEIIYIKGDSPSNWEDIKGTAIDSSYTRVITKSRQLSISTIEHAKYSVAIWPLQNGDRVSTAISKSVTGGAGGIFPENHIIGSREFDLKTYRLELSDNNSIISDSNIATIYSPASVLSGIDVIEITPAEIIKHPSRPVIKRLDNNTEFYITNAYWKDNNKNRITIEVDTIAGTGIGSTVVSGICELNTTRYGREILKNQGLPIDYQLYAASVSITGGKAVTSLSPGIIRVYQEGLAATSADYIEVESANFNNVQRLDETIQGSRTGSTFPRTLVIDAFDTNNVNNIANIKGQISIYAIPLVVDALGSRPIPSTDL